MSGDGESLFALGPWVGAVAELGAGAADALPSSEIAPNNLIPSDLRMWNQNCLFGVTGVGWKGFFNGSSAEGVDSSPLEKEAAFAAAAKLLHFHCRKALFLACRGTGEERGIFTCLGWLNCA